MTKVYEAVCVPDAGITVDGILDETAWEQANREVGFSFPWEDRPAPRTEFRAMFDRQALCFAFRVEDTDVVLARDYRSKEDVVREDRAELFFALDAELSEYFCLEIDPLGRVLDYRASYYRQMDFSWSFPGLEAAGRPVEGGYCVEGRIPWTAFQSLGFPAPRPGLEIKFGIYRAEFRHAAGAEWAESWISWVDPQTAEPDFHVPGSFGRLRLLSDVF